MTETLATMANRSVHADSQHDAGASSLLSVRSVVKSFGRAQVLRGVSLEIAEGEFLTILGESGSGKTTLLRLIAGFEQPDAGEIWMQKERLDVLPPFRRRVNTVFQQYALFPHLTVFENVVYGMRVQGTSKPEARERAERALAMVKMSAFSAAKPAQISGGQQQRIALARALVNHPRMLLLDEPLSALDANLRREMQAELKGLQREVGITFLFVTHDQEEALTLSDRVAVLRSGVLQQLAAPQEIYQRPATEYVAQFIGQTNLLECLVSEGRAQCGALSWKVNAADGNMKFSLRPECVFPANAAALGGEDAVRFHARVLRRIFQGPATVLHLQCGETFLKARVTGDSAVQQEKEFVFYVRDLVEVAAERGKS